MVRVFTPFVAGLRGRPRPRSYHEAVYNAAATTPTAVTELTVLAAEIAADVAADEQNFEGVTFS